MINASTKSKKEDKPPKPKGPEQTELKQLFAEDKEELKSKDSESSPMKLENYTILGYILLSKPSFQKAIDPLLVGCVYYNSLTKKFYLKIRKVIFLLHYLQNFITLDTTSGQQINKLTGKHLTDSSDP